MENSRNKPTTNNTSKEFDNQEDSENSASDYAKKNRPASDETHIARPSAGEMEDITPSGAIQEGDDLFNNELDTEIRNDPETNVSDQEREDLRRAANDMPGDDEGLREAALDDTDEDGTPLNEGGLNKHISGSDLDVPGSELDDADEEIGEEDEENNDYSLGGDDHPLN